MTDELSERTCTRCGRNPLNEVFLVGDERLCFDCKYHKQPAAPNHGFSSHDNYPEHCRYCWAERSHPVHQPTAEKEESHD